MGATARRIEIEEDTLTKKHWFAAFVIAGCQLAAVAPALASEEAAMPTEGADPTAHMQDGFYLSLGLGGGYFHDDFRTDFILLNVDGTAQGASGAGELLVGGALKKGLILGGGVFFEQVTNPTIEIEGRTVSDDISVGTLVVVGPFIDWYPTPGGGLHFRGALGGARITLKDESGNRKDEDDEPVGGAAVLAIGYGWWLADQWSIGIMGRVIGGGLRGDGIKHDVAATSFLVNVTYN